MCVMSRKPRKESVLGREQLVVSVVLESQVDKKRNWSDHS